MKQRYRLLLGAFAASFGLLLATATLQAPITYAAPADSAKESICESINDGGDCDATASSSVSSALKTVLNILSFLIGFVAIIMIVINGFKFVLSGGDAGQVKSARSGIIYALVGLAVAALAQILVHFVINQLNASQNPDKRPTAAQCKKNKKLKGC